MRKISIVDLACVFMIALLMGACASGNKIQTAPNEDKTAQIASAKVESENSEANDDQQVICRYITQTGSKMKKRFCATKAEWARINKTDRKNAESYVRKSEQHDALSIPSETTTDAMGGQSMGVPR